MQGAGNDFVVLDETQGRLGLSTAQYRFLADRHFGVGADQILSVRAASAPGIDFEYAIHNADGAEVEHCGNGARCFFRFVESRGLTQQDSVRVQTMERVLQLNREADGRVMVDMGEPVFDLPQIPFDPQGLQPQAENGWQKWPLPQVTTAQGAIISVAVVSMGNPHAVYLVEDVDAAPVPVLGPLVQSQRCFPNGVNVGFLQVLSRSQVRLRVYERGAGETLACGSGACAAVVAGIRLGLLDARVDVDTRGGRLSIAWDGLGQPVRMTGPATTVFEGSITIPD